MTALIANFAHALRALFDVAKMEKDDAPPAFCAFTDYMVDVIYDPAVAAWLEKNWVDFMPYYFLQICQLFFKAVAKAMDNVVNANVLESDKPNPEDINIKPIEDAVKAIINWRNDLQIKVAMDLPLTSAPSMFSVAAAASEPVLKDASSTTAKRTQPDSPSPRKQRGPRTAAENRSQSRRSVILRRLSNLASSTF